jgi:predicted aconitase
LIRILHEHQVRFVLIGGLAATLHGSAHPTFAVDITLDDSLENLQRLSAALRALDARVRVDGIPAGLPFDHDAASLARITVLNLVTKAGDLDIAMHPAGVATFSEWNAGAIELVVLGVPVRVASLLNPISSLLASEAQPSDDSVIAGAWRSQFS